MMPRPVISLIERYFNPTIPLKRRLLYVIPPSMLIGAGMELFMIQTGFCTSTSALPAGVTLKCAAVLNSLIERNGG